MTKHKKEKNSLNSALNGALTSSLRSSLGGSGSLILPVINGLVFQVAGFQSGKLKDELVTVDGSEAVSVWIDLSGNNNDVSQATTDDKPIYTESAINGFPALRFDGENDELFNSSPSGLPSGNNARTIFLVIDNALDSGDSWNFAFAYGFNSNLRTFDISLKSAVTPLENLALHVYGTDYVTGKNVIDGNPYIIAITYAGVDSTSLNDNTEIYVNGTFFDAEGGRNVDTPITLNTTSQNLYIGNRNQAGIFTAFAKTDIGEIIFYDRLLSTSEREEVESYLSEKWGIT